MLDTWPIDIVAPVHGDGFNGDRFGDLESLGYPERPETMLTGESMPINICFKKSL